MRILPVIVCLLAATPAFSQPKVYTNADLGRPLSPNRVSATPEQLASLAAHQFRAVSVDRAWEPVISTWSSSTAGPYGEFVSTIPDRRLDGSLRSDPQWTATHYGAYGFNGGYPVVGGYQGYLGHHGSHGAYTGRRQQAVTDAARSFRSSSPVTSLSPRPIASAGVRSRAARK
jgi:hypothetical protein